MSPGGHDAGRGEQRGVAHHPVVERQSGSLEPVRDRRDADAHHDEVGVDRGAVVEPDPLELVVPSKPATPTPSRRSTP